MTTSVEDMVLSDEEVQALLVNFLRSCPDGALEDDCKKIVSWAMHARLSEVLLMKVLAGALRIGVLDGEVVFSVVD